MIWGIIYHKHHSKYAVILFGLLICRLGFNWNLFITVSFKGCTCHIGKRGLRIGRILNMINMGFAEVMMDGNAKGHVFTFPIPTYNIAKKFD